MNMKRKLYSLRNPALYMGWDRYLGNSQFDFRLITITSLWTMTQFTEDYACIVCMQASYNVLIKQAWTSMGPANLVKVISRWNHDDFKVKSWWFQAVLQLCFICFGCLNDDFAKMWQTEPQTDITTPKACYSQAKIVLWTDVGCGGLQFNINTPHYHISSPHSLFDTQSGSTRNRSEAQKHFLYFFDAASELNGQYH